MKCCVGMRGRGIGGRVSSEGGQGVRSRGSSGGLLLIPVFHAECAHRGGWGEYSGQVSE